MTWLRQNFFGSWISSLFTLLLLYLLWKGVPPIIDWAFLDAVWRPDAKACRASEGACWGFIAEKHRFILFGTYPYEQHWRPGAATAILLSLHAKSGLVTFHGPVCKSLWILVNVGYMKRVLQEGEAVTFENLKEIDEDHLTIVENRVQTLHPGTARGRLLGGNLATGNHEPSSAAVYLIGLGLCASKNEARRLIVKGGAVAAVGGVVLEVDPDVARREREDR